MRFINHWREYSQVIRILSKGYLPISLTTFKIEHHIRKGKGSSTD